MNAQNAQNAPSYSDNDLSDLRNTLAAFTASSHSTYQVVFLTPYGERRTLRWLTGSQALHRAHELRRRGYKATVAAMNV